MSQGIDTVNLDQRVKLRKTGEEGRITRAVDFLDETYIEVTLDTGRRFWPLVAGDLEPAQ
jgi:hypothetical protein